jgi:hypothetical protein
MKARVARATGRTAPAPAAPRGIPGSGSLGSPGSSLDAVAPSKLVDIGSVAAPTFSPRGDALTQYALSPVWSDGFEDGTAADWYTPLGANLWYTWSGFAATGTWSAHPSNYYPYHAGENSVMFYGGGLNLQYANAARLEFDIWLDSKFGEGLLTPLVQQGSLETGDFWPIFTYYYESSFTGTTNGAWEHVVVDLAHFRDSYGDLYNFAGQNNVYIGFKWSTTAATEVHDGLWIDNVKVVKGSVATPVVTNISPTSASAGTNSQVTISGSQFGTAKGQVFFTYKEGSGGSEYIEAPVASWTATQIKAVVPTAIIDNYAASAGSGPVYVVSAEGGESAGTPFSVPFGYGGVKWPNPTVNYRINPSPYLGALSTNAVKAAANLWSNAGSNFRFNYLGSCTSGEPNQNGYNDVSWCQLDPGVIGIAGYTFDSGTGIIQECDTGFNTDYEWGVYGEADKMDVQTIATHELGHWLNLRDLYCDNDTSKIMYGYGDLGVVKPALTSGDRAGILWIYPKSAGLPAPTGLVVSPLTLTRTSMYWTKVPGATAYAVERSTSSASGFVKVGQPTANCYADTGLSSGATYYYRVRALGGSSPSSPSAVKSVKMLVNETAVVQQDYTGIAYTGTWATASSSSLSGGTAKRSTTSGSKVTIPFRGSKIELVGTKGPSYGKVNISIDGVTVATGLNLYAGSTSTKQTLFTRSGLSDSAHKMVVTLATSGKSVDIDAFRVTGVAPAILKDATSGFSGTWSNFNGSSYYGGYSKGGSSATAYVTFTFRGTGITWIGARSVGRGKAKVYIDGALMGTVDQFAGMTVYQAMVWRKTGMTLGTHTIKIMPTATHNPASSSNNIDVDAFAVR